MNRPGDRAAGRALGRARAAAGAIAVLLVASSCGGRARLNASTSVALPGGPSADCTVTVSPGGDVGASVASAGPAAVICVPEGTYTLPEPVSPASGQTIHGIGARAPTLTCGGSLCFDGRGAGTDVTLANLIMQGAASADIRTTDGWVLERVSVQTAADSGMKVQGANVTLRDVFAVSDGRFGIVAKDAPNLVIDGATIIDSPADASFEIGLSGGLKLNSVSGATIRHVDVHGGVGGAGIWIDNNTTDFSVSDSSVDGVAHDAIRIEISCRGTVSSSTVTSAGNAGLDVYNSHEIELRGNSVSGAGTWAIRMLSNGRSSGPGGDACLQDGAFPSTGNTAIANAVKLDEGVRVGVDAQGGTSSALSWSDNRYAAASCDAAVWTWWDGAASADMGFGGWQGLGQDITGSCEVT